MASSVHTETHSLGTYEAYPTDHLVGKMFLYSV